MSNKESNYERFITSYNYASLMKKYRLDEPGLWQVFGEDPNCDFGGSHVSPSLCFVEGTLNDVIEYAVELPNFWQWGAGGDIKKVDNIKVVDSKTVERRRFLLEKRAEHQKMLDICDTELGKL